jgi:two-component system chemotaxis response regulator CheB
MKILVIGGSSGALEPLRTLLVDLDPDLPFAVFVVLHIAAETESLIPEILSNHTRWHCEPAVDGDRIRAGRVVLARPDHHLLVNPGRISTPRGPKENGFRPAVDPLFRTAAMSYGERVIGIVLSGGLDDGAYGLKLIQQHGGTTLVQDPEEAEVPSMPASAIRAAVPHQVLPVGQMAAILTRLSAQGVRTMAFKRRKEKDVAERGDKALLAGSMPGPPSGFTCPDCGGALWELDDDRILHYRCHVGHAYNGSSLLNRSDEAMETALWTALRSLEESAALRRRMATKATAGSLAGLAQGYEKSSRELERQADVIREVLLANGWKAATRENASAEAAAPRSKSASARRK